MLFFCFLFNWKFFADPVDFVLMGVDCTNHCVDAQNGSGEHNGRAQTAGQNDGGERIFATAGPSQASRLTLSNALILE